MAFNARVLAYRGMEGQGKPIPASLSDLLQALSRLRGEAAMLADDAYLAIQHHSYAPYWKFRDKLEEHAALVTVIRGRLPQFRDAKALAPQVDGEEHDILALSVQSCLKFCFALSAKPLLPIGARETFIHELDALKQARRILETLPPEALSAALLNDLDTALMILEEIIEKSPSLVDFSVIRRHAAAAREPKPGGPGSPSAEAEVSPAHSDSSLVPVMQI